MTIPHEPHRIPAARAQGPRRTPDLRHPGDFALPYFRIIEQSGILPLYTLSHEPGVGFAADASARIQGGLGVAAVTYGAGALNMVNAVAAAYAEKSPLVVLSGGPGKGESRSGLLLHHQAKTLDSQFRSSRRSPATRCGSTTRRARRPTSRACWQLPAPLGAGVHRDPARHGAEPCAPVCARRRARSMPMRWPPAWTRSWRAWRGPLAGADGRRRGAPLRAGGQGGRAVAPARRAGGDQLHGPRPARRPGRAADGHLHGRGRPARGDALVEDSDGLFLLGEIICDTNFAVSETKIDMRKTIQALDGRVTMGYHTYPNCRWRRWSTRCWRASAPPTRRSP
jgi:indolepyruvate decarboxylase